MRTGPQSLISNPFARHSAVTRKLGEATYSEVFSLMYKDRLAALKIIPFGDLARGQPDVAGVVQEVKVARCLGRVGTGFVEMLGYVLDGLF